MNRNNVFKQRVHNFSEFYIKFPKNASSSDKHLTYDNVCETITLLLKEGIFSAEQKIKLDAAKRFYTILSDCYFTKAREILESRKKGE